MRRFARPKPLILIFAMVALLALIAMGQYLRLFERGWFNLHALWQAESALSIGLDRYQVTVEARVIDGLEGATPLCQLYSALTVPETNS